MRAILLASLLAAPFVHGHPNGGKSHTLNRRAIDISAFRLPLKAAYTDSKTTPDDAQSERFVGTEAADPIAKATELVKKTVPNATFRLVPDHYTGDNGVTHVNFKQTANDLDIDNADFNVNIGKDGKIFSFGNSFFTGEIPSAAPIQKRAIANPVDALKGITGTLGLPITAEAATAEAKEGKEIYAIKGSSGVESDPEARLVYFQTADALKLVWRVETDVTDLDHWLLTYVDAQSNKEIHGVVDYVADASLQVYPWGVNDPTEGARQVLTDPWDKTASEFGWFGTGSASYTTTRGNNAIAQSNPSGGSTYLNNYRPTSANLVFQYPYSPATTTPSTYVDAAITQLFYTSNYYHDLLHTLGFNERAGNFETNNNGAGGVGNDAVILNVQDGSGTNNANFATPADGSPGRMRMYLWTRTTPQRDCAFEAGVVIHEYTHGLSNRLTGGPANSGCLSSLESGGMGEGWGDFMATAIRLKSGDTRAKNYPMGAWVNGNTAGIRAYPYSTSTTTNPQTYKSADSMTAVHAIGTIWANMLYEVMWNLIDARGANWSGKPTLQNGVPTDGRYLAMKLVIDGMALQPCNPNFVSARDAIIDADEALTGGANACAIWTGFAKRGLGSGARYSSTSRTASTTIPAGVC
ncbi:hypothetical protein CAC42_757 [Sphaceloma murrayae]|uniref:Extracellular metalloproteinase n=1 Tax=Sphaceloma murrayae TaxID=2082308 RepID=A0A2K1QK22_9PEZI|nr:hypothetical protein CAC42_757 [Sphaceloma murrayae]